MTAATPPGPFINRTSIRDALTAVRAYRHRRSEAAARREELSTYQTASEISELSGIAARNTHVDTAERTVLSRQLAR
jgi:hypothetical protein